MFKQDLFTLRILPKLLDTLSIANDVAYILKYAHAI